MANWSVRRLTENLTGTYFDGSGGDVAVVRHARGEGRAIVEGEGGFVLGELQLFVEGVDLLPVFEDLLLFLGEVGPVRHYSAQGG